MRLILSLNKANNKLQAGSDEYKINSTQVEMQY